MSSLTSFSFPFRSHTIFGWLGAWVEEGAQNQALCLESLLCYPKRLWLWMKRTLCRDILTTCPSPIWQSVLSICPRHSAQPCPSAPAPACRAKHFSPGQTIAHFESHLCVLTFFSFLDDPSAMTALPTLPRTCAHSDPGLSPQKDKGQALDGPLSPFSPPQAFQLSHTYLQVPAHFDSIFGFLCKAFVHS